MTLRIYFQCKTVYAFVILTCCLGISAAIKPTLKSSMMHCEYYNETLCQSNKEGIGCNGSEECKPGESSKGNLCYILWQNSSEGYSIKLKGCWVGGHHDCIDKTHCMETKREPNVQVLFCCCEGDMCNKNMSKSPITISSPVQETKSSTSVPIRMANNSTQVFNILMYTLVPFIILTVVVAIAYWIYRHHKMAYFNELPTSEPSPLPPPSPFLGLRPIQLIEVKAQGRFGAVWKAQILNDFVAVKIFPQQDKNSWLIEQEIYKLPQMKHENILSFVGVEKRGDSIQSEYWLITAFHEKGSLCDYLKANLVSWAEVLSITDSIAKGLTHLHEELPSTKVQDYKPSIAHRDFKSKNVLIKSNMTACIADFGLALIFRQGTSPGEAHGQVGTRRYMAPEVLEGAINFNRDAFLRIDMYACGLVLWELVSRCSIQEGPVDEYMLPFEDTVGQHPTLEDMQEVVAQKKIRPPIKEEWRKNLGLAALCDTIEECWDHDAEARLSASCVQERINFLYRTIPPSSNHHIKNKGTKNSTSEHLPTIITSGNLQLVYRKESSI